jgi:hypothetical protein
MIRPCFGAIVAPLWRHILPLFLVAPPESEDRQRKNIRLEIELWEGIEGSIARRPGKTSRNTWIAEAVREKLERESQATESHGEE